MNSNRAKHINDCDGDLARQYGGSHTGKWVGKLPPSWIPFIQLARLSPPAGVFLVLFPHLYGIMHASILQQALSAQTIRTGMLVSVGSLFLSNAIHGWNDLVDAPIDKLVTRTKNRPIVRGAISPRAAFTFTASQALIGSTLLLFLPGLTAVTAIPIYIGA
ncbi:prenyltransferase, UbiA family protein [Metarhizium robertsii ARSEF 23]|uniref:Prenyltransferase, UbiA family protein n=1 Tax=Metarhizium robertsii (strain ARSEF 23 / ATCC MYA-3075) TaxID=655844 RepID=E9FBK5_METRA|nr:prenyltransferase, UbiA family protein [Metarhizium robertsii ARSEF 23]EFY94943.2 prenyltransferase, UbiA family protein [Metarhizium robertsii ARSEF 23]